MRKPTETTPHRPGTERIPLCFKPHREFHQGLSAAVIFGLSAEVVELVDTLS